GGEAVASNGGIIQGSGLVFLDQISSLKGDGTVIGSVCNRAVVQPGNTLGTLHIDGVYVQFNSAELRIELGGTTLGTNYDQLSVSSAASVAGKLSVLLTGGFAPVAGNTFD